MAKASERVKFFNGRADCLDGEIPVRIAKVRTTAGLDLKLAMKAEEADDKKLIEALRAADDWDGFEPIFDVVKLPSGVMLYMGPE